MSRSPPSYGRRATRFPRVSGDEPEADHIGLVEIKFSPRERG